LARLTWIGAIHCVFWRKGVTHCYLLLLWWKCQLEKKSEGRPDEIRRQILNREPREPREQRPGRSLFAVAAAISASLALAQVKFEFTMAPS
jgi:hypothetical protein